MTFRTFTTDKEFNQACFDNVARFVAQRAGAYISSGQVSKYGFITLKYLEDTLILHDLNAVTTSTYAEIIEHENSRLSDLLDD